MNEVSEALSRWLERKRRTDRASAAVISVLALLSGAAVFLLTAFVIYILLSIVCGVFVHSLPWLSLVASGLTGWIFVRSMKARQDQRQLGLDPMGFWILQDILSTGPRLILEGLRQVRRYGELGELNVAACAGALAYLAQQNSAVPWQELTRHCPQVSSARLREQLSLLDGVLFLGEDSARVTLMEPFRLRLRWLLEQEERSGQPEDSARPRPKPTPDPLPVSEPEQLSAYDILGLSPLASLVEIKAAYRKRIKECHPDLFAGMDQRAMALAERWTRALNAAYSKLTQGIEARSESQRLNERPKDLKLRRKAFALGVRRMYA